MWASVYVRTYVGVCVYVCACVCVCVCVCVYQCCNWVIITDPDNPLTHRSIRFRLALNDQIL